MSIKFVFPRQFMDEWEKGHQPMLLDVRGPGEYKAAHAPMATLMPLGDLNEHVVQHWGLMEKPVVLICDSGDRTQVAAEKLLDLGAREVTCVEGGMKGWIAAGLPVEQGTAWGLPLMRQVQTIIGLCVLPTALLAIFVHPLWAVIPAIFGAGLIMAGLTGWCGLALLVARMPWNRTQTSGQSCPAK